MLQEGTAKKRRARYTLILGALLCFFASNSRLFAMEPQSTEAARPAPTLDLELLSRGRPMSPLLWNNFRQAPIPPVDPNNGPKVSSYVKQGKMALSLSDFLHLVLENNLGLQA